MKIIEIRDIDDVNELIKIASTYPKTQEESLAVEKQLQIELSEAGDNRHIYVCYDNDVCVAMIQLILKNADNDPEYANGKDIAHVHNLQVRKDRQNEGIGKLMMDYIEDKAKEMGKRVLTLGVDSDNERAIKLYKNRDYKIFRKDKGRTPDEWGYAMKKEL